MSNAHQQNFIFSINDLPNTQFDVLTTSIPSITLTQTPHQTPYGNIPRPSNTIEYSDFTLTFIVDENYVNYFECYNWMQKLRVSTPETIRDLSDAHLVLLNNNKNEIYRIKFESVWPSILGEVQLNSSSASDIITCDLTISYTQFVMEAL